MAAQPTDLLERKVDHLFVALKARHGDYCRNPVTGVSFAWGLDPLTVQKTEAVRALRAYKWFSVNGPSDAPRLPLSHDDVDDYRNARGLKGVLGFYARSLSRGGYGRQSYEVLRHPSFDDFARGLMAMAVNSGLWGLENDAELKRRFPPRPLAGMTPGAYWASPKEYAETIKVTRQQSRVQ